MRPLLVGVLWPFTPACCSPGDGSPGPHMACAHMVCAHMVCAHMVCAHMVCPTADLHHCHQAACKLCAVACV